MSEEKKKKKGAEEPLKNAEEVKTEERNKDVIDGYTEEEAKGRLREVLEEKKQLETENETLKKKAEEAENDYLRARADCENVRKRKAEEIRSAYDDGKTETVAKMLAIGDSLDWALKMPLDEKTKEGIEKLLKKYHETLESAGVKEFSPEEGSPFDPNTAQAVMQADAEEGDEPNTVKKVFGRGYKLGEKVIRYAQVSVVK